MLGFLFAIVFAGRLAKKENIDPNHFFDMGFVALLAGIAGARLLFIIQPTDDPNVDFSGAIFNVFDGHLSIIGILVGLAGAAGLYLAREEIKWLKFVHKKNPRTLAFFAITAVLLALILGRTFYCLMNRDHGYNLSIFEIWRGGLVWYGGFGLAFTAGAVFVILKKLPLRKITDIGAPHIILGLGFGRIGCFLNGCCWGKVSDWWIFSWCTFPKGSAAWTQHRNLGLIPETAARSLPVIPTQLMASLFAFCTFVLLMIIYRNRKRDGQVMLALCFIYPAYRIVLEACRADNLHVAGGLTMSQWISVVIIIVSLAAFIRIQMLPAVAGEGALPAPPEPEKKSKRKKHRKKKRK